MRMSLWNHVGGPPHGTSYSTRITTFNISSKDFGCFNCSPTALFVCFMCSPNALRGLCLSHVFTNRSQRTLLYLFTHTALKGLCFVSCVHKPHSKDFVCFICSSTALKGLCLFHVFTHRTQRILFVSYVHKPHSACACGGVQEP